VPATIQSRSQVFELKTIGLKQIAEQLRRIADAEQIEAGDDALMLIARAGDGSMRDAQSAFDQVLGFAGTTLTAADVAAVLGLVRRDLLIEIAGAVAAENAAALFELAGRAVEAGYDLRLVVRELARLTRDLLVLSIDEARISDPEIAADAERQALLDLSRRFSGEDLMRAFDVLTKAEYEIRGSMQPRYHLEMALLRWVHLRKLTPLADLIKQVEGGGPVAPPVPPKLAPASGGGRLPPASGGGRAVPAPVPPPGRTAPPAPMAQAVRAVEGRRADAAQRVAPTVAAKPASAADRGQAPAVIADPATLKEAFLDEVRKQKKFFHGTVVAQALRIELQPDAITFHFGPQHKALRVQLEQTRPWLEETASRLAGRKMIVTAAEGPAPVGAPAAPPVAPGTVDVPDRAQELKDRAMADTGVQAMLDVFAAEIKDIEEM
jgi:DNA polymerase-3 subunit gamma/tau